MDRRLLGWLAVLVQFLLIAAIMIAAGRSSWSPWWVIVLGGATGGAGLLVLGRAAADLGDALTANPVPKNSRLRTDGLYRYVRHPIYAGLLLAMIGVLLTRPSWWGLLCWCGLLGWLVWKSSWEERMLRERFPEYDAYRRRTGRFVPRAR